MIQAIRKVCFFIFRKLIPVHWLADALREESLALAKNNAVLHPQAKLTNGARILNLQDHPEKIYIGANSMICGELQVNAYGGSIHIGDNTYVGEYSRIWSGDKITIGNNVQISHNVNIIDNNTHSLNSEERKEEYRQIITAGKILQKDNIAAAPIIIEDDVWISFNASILKGVRIGRGAVIAAGAVITKDVEAFTVVAGNPAVVIKNIITVQ
ncbi:MAG: acyltransferase [Cyclobacteriaceae bacterium]|nr:MAG: acyltransferase [Cyclobacteriaceae bacterium]